MADASDLALALAGTRVLSLALNIPGPVAASRLRDLGARVTKVESPRGDPLARAAPAWFAALHRSIERVSLDLKVSSDRAELDARLADTDVLLTSSRPSALARLGLAWDALHARHPRIVHVAIVGEMAPYDERPGHDLTYVARAGLLEPPAMPRVLVADFGGAERAVTAVLALLLRRTSSGAGARAEVALRDAAEAFAAPLRYGLTAKTGALGGAFPTYALYRARDAWIAVAALEPHFAATLAREIGADLAREFAAEDAATWERFGIIHDIPIARVATRAATPTDLEERPICQTTRKTAARKAKV